MSFPVRIAAFFRRFPRAHSFALIDCMNSVRESLGRTAAPGRTGTLTPLVLVLAGLGLAVSAAAQGALGSSAGAVAPAPAAAFRGQAQSPEASTATIFGTVISGSRAEIAGAHVLLDGNVTRTALTGSNGAFSFSSLPTGVFSVTVSAQGMRSVTLRGIALHQGDIHFLPPIILHVAAASTSVQVFAEPEMLAQQQLHVEMHQRVLGVLPNYYETFNWNAEHLWPKQKFELGFRAELDPVTITTMAAEAGIEQYYNRFPSFGQSTAGYFKRFGAAYATDFTGTIISDAALPVLFHQDPRFFYKSKGSFISRALYAVSQTVICRGDNGREEFDYSRVLGNFAAGGISNFYYPPADRGVSLTFVNGAIDLAANASTNLVREFVLPSITSNRTNHKKQKTGFHFPF